MKFLMLLTLLMVTLAGPASAGDIYVPDNSPSSGSGTNSWPFKTYSDWRYQMLIPAKLLGGHPTQIVDMGIAPSTGAAFTASTFQVRFAHTLATSLSMTFATNLVNPTTMYDGPIAFTATTNQWSPIGLTGAFNYDGSSSLVVEVRYKSGSKNVRVWTSTQLERAYTHSGNSNDPYNATTAITPVPGPFMGMKVHLKTRDSLLIASGTGKLGTAIDFILKSPADPGLPYQVGTSLGKGPTPIGTRQLGLSLDDLLVVSVGGLLPPVFRSYNGFLDSKGEGTAKLNIINYPLLVGTRLYTAYMTLKGSAPHGIKSISSTFDFVILQ